MKFFVLFFIFVAAAYTLSPDDIEQLRRKIEVEFDNCMEETAADDDDIAPLEHNKTPTTEKGKCFLFCMHKKFGLQTQSGKIDGNAIRSMAKIVKDYDADLYFKVKQVLNICLDKVTEADNGCDTAAYFYDCLNRERQAVGIYDLDISK